MRVLAAIILQMILVSCAAAQTETRSPQPGVWPDSSDLQSAELVDSKGSPARDLAERLVEESGLKAWNGQPPLSDLDGLSMDGFFLYQSDGAAISTFFLPSEQNSPGFVCVVREARLQVGDQGKVPVRWCADQLGVTLPDRDPPPVIVREGS